MDKKEKNAVNDILGNLLDIEDALEYQLQQVGNCITQVREILQEEEAVPIKPAKRAPRAKKKKEDTPLPTTVLRPEIQAIEAMTTHRETYVANIGGKQQRVQEEWIGPKSESFDEDL